MIPRNELTASIKESLPRSRAVALRQSAAMRQEETYMTSTLARITIFSLSFLLLFMPLLTSAETKIFIKEYTFQAGDEDSKNSSRTIALREVKRLLLEELGTYLESETKVENFKLTKDQIITLTAGIVQTELVEEKWDGRVYWLKAKIVADSDNVLRSIDNLRQDRQKTKELEETRKKAEALLKQNERLRQELAKAKGKKRQNAIAAYDKTIKELNAIEWFEKGESSLTLGNYDDAIVAYSKAIELNHQYASAYIGRGIAYHFLDNYSKAIYDFSKIIELNPKDIITLAVAYLNRGVAYKKIGDYRQSIRDYDKALDLGQKDQNFKEAVYYNRGIAYDDSGNHDQAIRDLDKAIELNPLYERAYVHRGIAHDNLGEYLKAVKDYSKAIEINPSNYKAYNNRGGSYVNLKNYQQAITDFDKAIELNPKVAATYGNRGIAYRNIGNNQQAIKDFDKVIELDPKLAWAYFNRGITYFILENDKQRNADLKIAARLGHKGAQEVLKTIGVDW